MLLHERLQTRVMGGPRSAREGRSDGTIASWGRWTWWDGYIWRVSGRKGYCRGRDGLEGTGAQNPPWVLVAAALLHWVGGKGTQ